MTEPSVQSLRLPGSRWVLQWRDDGRWRDVSTQQLADELLDRHQQSPDDWVPSAGDQAWHGRGGSRRRGTGNVVRRHFLEVLGWAGYRDQAVVKIRDLEDG